MEAIIIYILCTGLSIVFILSACLAMTYCRRKDVFKKPNTTHQRVPSRQNITIV